jgi:glycosyltransferase involved in cell wall biosynthesis
MDAEDTMKIGLLTSWVSYSGGGVSEAVRRQAASLQAAPELQVEVFGLAERPMTPGRAEWDGIAVTALPTRGPRAWGYAPRLSAMLAGADLDLLHVHGLWMYPSMASLGWACATSRPYMVTPHGMLDSWAVRHSPWKKRAALWAYEARHLRGAACLHALCEAEAEAIRAFGLRNAICIVPNGVDRPGPLQAGTPGWHGRLPDKARILLYLGRLHPKKGLVDLLHAWHGFDGRADAGKDDWHLAIAGWNQNDHERELRQLVETLSMAGSVHFLGPQFGADKDALFRDAAAFVLPSVSEGLPMVVLEAWSHGLPVLMTRHCNLPEGYQAGGALEIDTGCEGIRHGLQMMARMTDKDRLEAGQAARQLCNERFSQRRTSDMMKAVYGWLLHLGPRPACVVID